MQVSATLIAAQQAAREARTRLAMPQQAQAAPQANFAAALEKTTGADQTFSALPLRQTVAPMAAAPAQQPAPNAFARLGQYINIVV